MPPVDQTLIYEELLKGLTAHIKERNKNGSTATLTTQPVFVSLRSSENRPTNKTLNDLVAYGKVSPYRIRSAVRAERGMRGVDFTLYIP